MGTLAFVVRHDHIVPFQGMRRIMPARGGNGAAKPRTRSNACGVRGRDTVVCPTRGGRWPDHSNR